MLIACDQAAAVPKATLDVAHAPFAMERVVLRVAQQTNEPALLLQMLATVFGERQEDASSAS